MYQASGDPRLAAAARFWLAHAVELRRPGEGVGGYLSWEQGESGELEWRAEPGVLTGAAGVALALLGGLAAVEPAWDRLLLCDVPPRSSPDLNPSS
ncbi:MAG: hypothetical protein D6696_20830 [Acidobacteria bacterium]|nr:MAG: hypothetical protein D6696_20830 [Acidobacteriota bacterium]